MMSDLVDLIPPNHVLARHCKEVVGSLDFCQNRTISAILASLVGIFIYLFLTIFLVRDQSTTHFIPLDNPCNSRVCWN